MKTVQQAIARPAPGHVRARTKRMKAGLGTVGELYRALVQGGRWWMFPMIAILGLTSILLVAIAALEYVAPFVYTIF